jgi:hypothetical protein
MTAKQADLIQRVARHQTASATDRAAALTEMFNQANAAGNETLCEAIVTAADLVGLNLGIDY